MSLKPWNKTRNCKRKYVLENFDQLRKQLHCGVMKIRTHRKQYVSDFKSIEINGIAPHEIHQHMAGLYNETTF